MRDKIAEIIRNARMNANPLAQVGYAEADALIANGAVLLTNDYIIYVKDNWLMLNMESKDLGEAIKRIVDYAAGKK